jgi:predicted nucleotidyltransferase
MTTLSDLGVTSAKLRAYGHDGTFEALTGKQLQGICCVMKTILDKKEGKYKRWNKETQRVMRGIGVIQSQRTGEPIINFRRAKVVENISVSLEDFNRVEDELSNCKELAARLADQVAELSKPVKGKRRTKAQIEADKAK